MNKADLVEAVQRALDVGRRDATHYVEQLFAVLSEALARGERVKVNRFGLFVAKMRPARLGRDPRDGSPLELPARRTVSFRAAPRLKEKLQTAPLVEGDDAG